MILLHPVRCLYVCGKVCKRVRVMEIVPAVSRCNWSTGKEKKDMHAFIKCSI